MTDSRPPRRRTMLVRWLPLAAVLTLAGGAVLVRVRFGVSAVVLWLAFSALAAAVLLFWESVRLLVDPNAAGDEPADDAWAVDRSELEQRRKAALRALKDIEFEHGINRLSDEDYAALREQYRAEARAAMEAMESGLGAYLQRAEELLARATGERVEVPAEGDAAKAGGEPRARTKKGKKGPGEPSRAERRAEAHAEKPAERPAAASGEADAAGATADEAGAAPAVAASEGSDATATAAPTCGKCGTVNDADAVFCKRCATRLTEVA